MQTDRSSALGPFRRRVDAALLKLLGPQTRYFASHLPAECGALAQWLRVQFFSGLALRPEEIDKIKALPPDAILVYATQYRSRFEYHFFHSRLVQLGLTCPEIAFDYRMMLCQPVVRALRIVLTQVRHLLSHFSFSSPYTSGFLRQSLTEGKAGFMSLVEERGFYRRFVKSKPDPIRFLIELQQTTDRPVCILPSLMFFGKSPQRTTPSMTDIIFGPEDQPGMLRRLLTLFRQPGKVFVEVSEPVDLKQFLAEPDHRQRNLDFLSLNLRRRLLVRLNRHRQSITGPVLKTREEMKEAVLTTEQLTRFMNAHAQAQKKPLYKVRMKADSYLEEIAAKYNIGVIKIYSVILNFIFNRMFDGVAVNYDILNKVKTAAQKGPIIFIPCHKSHIDYLILSYLLYHHNMPCPHIAAGKNLSFWPMGPIFRSGGAFFIRRTFKGKELYARVFSQYIHRLLADGFNIEFFIEGGRSRTGKLILPKLGLLSIILEAFEQGACEDLVIAPVYIGYDRVLEEKAYLSELEGGKKKPENFKQVIQARRFLKKRHGRIYIRFHEPMAVRELIERMGTPFDKMTKAERRILYRNLGHRVINAINRVTVVTPHAVVAAVVLNIMRKRFTLADMMKVFDAYLAYLVNQKATLADTLMLDHRQAAIAVLDSYVQRKFVELVSLGGDGEDGDQVYTPVEGKRPNLEYYKNNCIGFFVPAAYAAIAILATDAFQFRAGDLRGSCTALRELFKNEFAYNVDHSVELDTRKSLKAFIDEAVLMPHPTLPDTYNLTSSGFRKLKLFAGFLVPYLESYWIVLQHLKETGGSELEVKDRLKKIEALGNRMYRKEEIDRKEALSKVNYKNGLEFFISRGATGPDGGQVVESFSQKVHRYLNLMTP
jgi:glycerol-3-phosphate O-acyltransferase